MDVLVLVMLTVGTQRFVGLITSIVIKLVSLHRKVS